MAGDERVRHCTLCDLNVYNFAEMSGDEVRELLARSEGRVCARLYRRADGTILTKDCPRGVRALRQKLSQWSSATMAALMSMAALVTGCATLPASKTKVKLEVERTATAQPASFTGVVGDRSGAPMPGVTVVLRNESVPREIRTVTDSDGAFALNSLSEGLYRVEIALAGFDSALVEHVALKPGEITHARVSLQVSAWDTVTVGVIAVEQEPMNDRLTTTFPADFLKKIPF